MIKQVGKWIVLSLSFLGVSVAGWLVWQAAPPTSYASAAPTTEPAVFIPLAAHAEPTPFPLPGIQGYVKDNGNAAGGIQLELRRYNGSSWSTQATTQTDSAGFYLFTPPSLSSGQHYYVRYLNPENLTSRLAFWGTRVLDNYTSGQTAFIGNFDLHNIELQTPTPGATVSIPTTFHWAVRPATPSDSYELDLFDFDDGDPYFYTNPALGFVGVYTLNHLPGGFSPGVQYVWGLAAYSPDGGVGLSYWVYGVTFSNGLAAMAPTHSLPAWSVDQLEAPSQRLAPTP